MNEDARAKLGLQALLSPFVPLLVHHEVQPPAQFADLFVSAPPASPEPMVQTLGALGRIASVPTLLEAFSDTLTLDEARDCIRKQYTLHHTLVLEAKRLREAGQPVARVAFPWLWMLSLGEPKAVLHGWSLAPSGRWPQGMYRSLDAVAVGVVVLRQLQPERETLALRLFGDEPMRKQAARELAAMGEGEPLRRAVEQMLYRWRVWLKGHPEDEATRRRLMDFEQLVEEETRRLIELGRSDGLERGRVEEARKAVGRVLARRKVEVTAEQQGRLASCEDLATLERWLDQAITASNADDALR